MDSLENEWDFLVLSKKYGFQWLDVALRNCWLNFDTCCLLSGHMSDMRETGIRYVFTEGYDTVA